MALYVTFILLIVLAFVSKVIPDMKLGFNMGTQLVEMQLDNNGEFNNAYMLPSVQLEYDKNPQSIKLNNDQIEAVQFVEQSTIFIQTNSDEGKNLFKTYADNSTLYFLNLLLALSYIIMLLLVARIIYSLRRSIIMEQSVERSNVRRVRLIGAILIMGEMINAGIMWTVNIKAAEVLQGSGLHIVKSFSPDYWIIMLGILVLFMGELFAIAHAISEEQKLTI